MQIQTTSHPISRLFQTPQKISTGKDVVNQSSYTAGEVGGGMGRLKGPEKCGTASVSATQNHQMTQQPD